MKINGERVTVTKLAEWMTSAHEANVQNVAGAMLCGYEVRADDSVPSNTVVFLANSATVESARLQVAKFKSENTE